MYTVHYDSIIENSGPLYDQWEYTPTTEMGANYYKVLADFSDLNGGSSVNCNSALEGIKLTIWVNPGSFTNQVVKIASWFLKVPYVYGMHDDEDGNYVGKCYGGTKTYQGFYGTDCSGLATLSYDFAYYYGHPDEWMNVCNTNAQMLYNKYHKSGLTFSDRQPGDMVFIDYNEDGTVDHVGIVCDDTAKVIHATGAVSPDTSNWPYNHPRSVMYEKFSHRSYWRDPNKFKGIGRK